MQVLSLLPLSLSSLVATQHFSSFLLHRICQAIYPTHTLSDISHILYFHPPFNDVSPFTQYLVLWPLTLHIPRICRRFDVTSERVVCNGITRL